MAEYYLTLEEAALELNVGVDWLLKQWIYPDRLSTAHWADGSWRVGAANLHRQRRLIEDEWLWHCARLECQRQLTALGPWIPSRSAVKAARLARKQAKRAQKADQRARIRQHNGEARRAGVGAEELCS